MVEDRLELGLWLRYCWNTCILDEEEDVECCAVKPLAPVSCLLN